MSTDAGSRQDRAVDIIAYCFCLVMAILFMTCCQRVSEFNPDAACYMGLAKSLQSGQYRFNFEAHTIYPPGFPALLSALSAAVGCDPLNGWPLFMRFTGGCGALFLLVSYWLIRRGESPRWALACIALMGSSPFLFQACTRHLGSDIPYAVVSLASLLIFHRIAGPLTPSKGRWPAHILFSILFLAAITLRAVGLALLIALALWIAWEWSRNRRPERKALVATLALGIIAQAGWFSWRAVNTKALTPGEDDMNYGDDFLRKDPHQPDLGKASARDLLLRPVIRFGQETSHVTEFFAANRWIDPVPFSPFVAIPALLIGVGLLPLAARSADLSGPYFVAYSVIMFAWPYDVGPRYLFPILPLAFFYLRRGWSRLLVWAQTSWSALLNGWLGISIPMAGLSGYFAATSPAASLQQKASVAFWTASSLVALILRVWPSSSHLAPFGFRSGRALRAAAYAFVLVVCSAGFWIQAGMARTNRSLHETDIQHYPTAQAARWLRDHTGPDAVVMSYNAWIIHPIAGRKTVLFPPTADARLIMDAARRHNASFLVILDDDQWYKPLEEVRLQKILTAYPSALELVQSGNRYRIFRFSCGPWATAAPDGAPTCR